VALPFVHQLLGFAGTKPNTADGDSAQSVTIARGVLDILGVTHAAPGGQPAGSALEAGVHAFLSGELSVLDPSRDWTVGRGGQISQYRQYEHLARVDLLIRSDPALRVELGVDYLISPDVTVSFPHGLPTDLPILHAAISCKFSIRSDRVQNIRHESIAMIRHRRGRQPHIVAVTSEPLPSRLAAICRGTGEVDAVYHSCLAELQEAVATVGNAEQQAYLDEIVGQRRLFDLADLAAHLTV
jgi:hypothetical protein